MVHHYQVEAKRRSCTSQEALDDGRDRSSINAQHADFRDVESTLTPQDALELHRHKMMTLDAQFVNLGYCFLRMHGSAVLEFL